MEEVYTEIKVWSRLETFALIVGAKELRDSLSGCVGPFQNSAAGFTVKHKPQRHHPHPHQYLSQGLQTFLDLLQKSAEM